MKKLIIILMIIGILLSGCVSKTDNKADNNDTNNDQKDGGESDVVEKIGTNANIKFVADIINDIAQIMNK